MIPFKSGMVVVGSDFCGRKSEIRRLKESIKSYSRVCLIGERRLGKTSLVYETVRQLKGYSLIFIDLLGVKSSDDVIRRVMDGIFSSAHESALSRMIKSFASLRPVVGLDPLTNSPTLSLSPNAKTAPNTLEEALEYINKQKRMVVFFDEFQALLDLPPSEQSDIVARMRSRIQLHTNTPYIFAGSLRNEMDRMFFDHSSPFYKAAIRFEIGSLVKTDFMSFITNAFASGERSIGNDLLTLLFETCHDVPGDIQRLCQSLWSESSAGDTLDMKNFASAIQRLLCDEERAYTIFIENITGQQLKCLRALAEVGGAASLGGHFISLTGIVANSSIQRALNSLVKKRIIFRDSKLYRFCDPFFGEWIRYKRL
jgi:AAA+ ATPase superfamily predicted ATPase